MRAAIAALAALLLPGVAAAQTSPSPYTSAVRYDDDRRVVGTLAPDADGVAPYHYLATRNTYDAAGRLLKVEKGDLTSWQSDSVAPASWPVYDPSTGAGFQIFQTIDTTYDVMDRKLTETVSSGGTAYGLTQYSYDAMGRLECTALRMNPAVYGSLPSSACTLGTTGTQGPDRITKTVYDVASQVLKVQRAYGTALQQDYASYSYSANGKQTSIIDANGNKAAMSYDGYDRQTRWSFPDKVSVGAVSTTDFEAYTYDPNGNRLSLQKRDGQTIGYSYDALNRLNVKDIPGGTAADVYYAYDLRGLQLSARFGSASGLGLVQVYDGFGRLTSASNTLGGTTLTLSYLWDADGNRTRVTHPDGTYFTYDYDGLDRQTGIKQSGSTSVATIAYDVQGRRSGDTRGSVATTYGYDGISRPTSLADDLAGTTADVTTTFAYNPASQLITKVRSNTAYAFSGYVTLSRSYAANGLNQYTTGGPATFTYDANGNLTGDGTSAYTYDVENRLITRGSSFAMAYDPSGRLWQTVGSSTGTTRYLYDGDELVVEYDGSGTVLRRYVHGSGADDPNLWYEGSTLTDRRSLQSDQQGSIVSVANASGTALQILAYDEYGIPAASNSNVRFQYTGQAWLPDLGMYYYKARIYSPTLGRFLQTDPIGYKDQVNLYAYVGNDPVNGHDPSGMDTVVQLQSYDLRPPAGTIGYQHQYVLMRDTDTGETMIARAGPHPDYTGGVSDASNNVPSTNPNGQVSTVTTELRQASLSTDSNRKTGQPLGTPVEGGTTTIAAPLSKVVPLVKTFNNSVDSAKTPYRPQSTNSNAYAGTLYRTLTGQTPPTSPQRPGSAVVLPPYGAKKPEDR